MLWGDEEIVEQLLASSERALFYASFDSSWLPSIASFEEFEKSATYRMSSSFELAWFEPCKCHGWNGRKLIFLFFLCILLEKITKVVLKHARFYVPALLNVREFTLLLAVIVGLLPVGCNLLSVAEPDQKVRLFFSPPPGGGLDLVTYIQGGLFPCSIFQLYWSLVSGLKRSWIGATSQSLICRAMSYGMRWRLINP